MVLHGSVGLHPSDNNALKLRHGGMGQRAGVPWVAGSNCSGAGSGQPHPFTGCKHRQEDKLCGSGSGMS